MRPSRAPRGRRRQSALTTPRGKVRRLTSPTTSLEIGELPKAYGTKELLLAARDPRSLYVRWDLTVEQQRHYEALAPAGHLLLRVHAGTPTGPTESETPVGPQTRHCFLPVGRPGGTYVAELGYVGRSQEWVRISTSEPVVTPQDTVSEDRTVRFATFLPEVPLKPRRARGTVGAAGEGPLRRIEAETRVASPTQAGFEEWTSEQEQAMAELGAQWSGEAGGAGSEGIPELIRGEGGELVWNPEAGGAAGGAAGVSSPTGPGQQPARAFWFNVNAELIVYGATEPDAAVTLGGQPVQLRPDGTFSCRFVLPDGDHELTAVATSAQGDTRHVRLRFSRRTE